MTDQETINRYFEESGRSLGSALTSLYPPVSMDDDGPTNCIPDPAVPIIALAVMTLVAEVLQAYIDAGSEREVTMENEILYSALEGEIGGWGDNYQKYEKKED
jgi:hypothetical protein